MGAIASQITSLTIVYSTVYSGADQRKHQSSASLAFVRGLHRWSVNSTVTCPHRVNDDMCESIDGLVCGTCFLDIEKRFDTIDYDILLEKLKYYGINGHERREWILDELRNRFCTIFATNSGQLALAIRKLHALIQEDPYNVMYTLVRWYLTESRH